MTDPILLPASLMLMMTASFATPHTELDIANEPAVILQRPKCARQQNLQRRVLGPIHGRRAQLADLLEFRRREILMVAAVLLLCTIDLRQYYIFFVQHDLYELVTAGLLRALQILK